MGGREMEIDAGLCRLRPYRESDRAAILELANDDEVARNLTDRFPHPYTDDDATEWLALCASEGESTRNFAVEVDGQYAGGIGLELREGIRVGSAEIGYWLGRRFWGQGVATAATKALVKYCFDTFGFDRLEATVFGWNPASARVLEKAGFQLEGRLRQAVLKDGERTDLVVYGLLTTDDD
jgi:RimJ/RimL family protein N-acetyltransferase